MSNPTQRPGCYRVMTKPRFLTLVEAGGDAPLPVPEVGMLEGASLFLDFDGTLVEIAAHPGAVVVTDRLRSLMIQLAARLPGRLAIISGRPIGQLKQLLGPMPLAFGGSHGMELLWPDGTAVQPARPTALAPVLQEFRRLQKSHTAIVIEQKPYGVALHYRNEPRAEAVCRALATSLAQSSGLELQAGKMVFELRAPGADKGGALKALLAGPGMAGTLPVFIGDDDTDETAFVAAAELDGAGILVGPARPTAARYRLASVTATLAWLEAAGAALR
jgi:trehalose 6-phosphate phosphatase